jgi:hypothetical protein
MERLEDCSFKGSWLHGKGQGRQDSKACHCHLPYAKVPSKQKGWEDAARRVQVIPGGKETLCPFVGSWVLTQVALIRQSKN